ncbi:hypothetical protein H0Z60_10200 [Ectothiorhodospiraceae bacterium WFHF3C12]|nr:hypothetical protein [Ectothiorhodospiraceae bacterium WFHF3C12]
MAMTRPDLVVELKAALGQAAQKFDATNDADFKRYLDRAALALARKRPRTKLGSITLTAGEALYTPPADLAAIKSPLWGMAKRRETKPWQVGHPGRLPWPRLVETDNGVRICIEPAPTAEQITQLGAEYSLYYYAAHRISDTESETTVAAADRHLLILRAMIEAMRELAASGSVEPVQLHRGMGSTPRNGTPQALQEALSQAYEREAG